MGSCWWFFGPPEASWGPPGAFRPSLPLLGACWSVSWAAPGSLAAVLGRSRGRLGHLWMVLRALLGRPGPLLGYPGCLLNLSWASFGGSRAAPGSQRRLFTTPCKTAIFNGFPRVFQAGESLRGASLGPLGRPWGRRGASWAVLGGFGWLLGRPKWLLGGSWVVLGWLLSCP